MPAMADFILFFGQHPAVWWGLAAFVGACMASFGGVVVDRLPHSAGWRPEPEPGVSLMTPSRCNACGTRIGLLPLVPVLGWLLARGRCASCGARVPAVYPLMELSAGCFSAAWAVHCGPGAAGALGLVLMWSCMILGWLDWREAWLPDRIQAPLLVLGLLFSPFEPDPMLRIQGLALAAGAMGLCLGWLSWRRSEGMFSGGDVMFCAMAGSWLGMAGVPVFLLATSALYVSCHVVQRATGRRWEPADPRMRELLGDASGLPVGPAMALALAACLWLGPLASIR